LAYQLDVDVAGIVTIKSIYRGKAGPQAEGSVERRLRAQRLWARTTLGFGVFSPSVEKELVATLAMRARCSESARIGHLCRGMALRAQDYPTRI
jgi:hypothetical protein